jgi:hypothetical protein
VDRQDIAQQTQVEHELLRHIIEGLRRTAGWQVPGPDASRKLSTLRFIAQSFQRHLERLLALEEHDGYLEMVRRIAPWLSRAADALGAQHDAFRGEARRLVERLERPQATEAPGLDEVCAGLPRLLDRIEEHSRKEVALFQEAIAREDGGEG